jgi:predicted outer membrane protein
MCHVLGLPITGRPLAARHFSEKGLTMRHARGLIFAVTLALLGTAIATAQTEGQQREREPQTPRLDQQTREEQPGRQGGGDLDRIIASCLAIENSAEVQMAEFATQRLQNEQAREFAQQLVRDHRAMLEKLQQFGATDTNVGRTTGARGDVSVRAGQTGVDVDVNRNADQPRATDRAERRSDRADARADRADARTATTAAAGGFDPIAIKREIAQECLRSFQQELESTDDPDRCFVGAQVVGHHNMLSALKVFQRHASPELAELLAQASTTTQTHLDHGKQLLKALDKKAGAGTAAAPTGVTR